MFVLLHRIRVKESFAYNIFCNYVIHVEFLEEFAYLLSGELQYPGVNFTNVLLEQLLRAKIPKAEKDSQPISVFGIFAHFKAAHIMLVKLTPSVNFINILRAHFLYESLFKAKLKAEKSCSICFCMKNGRLKC